MNTTVSLRVWGDFACFTRPEMKVERVSYRVPTPSAARGVLEAVFWEPEMYYLIDSITVVKPGKWFSFRRNEVGKVINLKDPKPIHAGGGAEDAAQRNMLALAGVDYIFTAEIRLTEKGKAAGEKEVKYVEQFKSRAAKGKCAHRPALGVREFSADFELVEGPPLLTNGLTEPDGLGIMLYDVFDPTARRDQKNALPQPVFFRAEIANGRMDCHPDRVTILRPGTGKV
ncbi:MAG: type I-C CRISPR-associated protein Cas5c [Fimbriiglobus sp.]